MIAVVATARSADEYGDQRAENLRSSSSTTGYEIQWMVIFFKLPKHVQLLVKPTLKCSMFELQSLFIIASSTTPVVLLLFILLTATVKKITIRQIALSTFCKTDPSRIINNQ